ncbi:MAG: nitrous oxide reductase accessory protein NosL [Magnetococcales bacterium]|nr:nitrous oxide reductase accessory protein NosL [Magnetococcales bacterium]
MRRRTDHHSVWPIWLALILWIGAWNARSGESPADRAVPAGSKCPVCGMFVAKYPEWVALVVWADGTVHHFDGAKDLFRFLAQPERFAPGRDPATIGELYVTEYYGLKRIPARSVWYVTGSDVHGPMGHELIPLANEQEAREFTRDHAGREMLRFEQITPQVLSALETL